MLWLPVEWYTLVKGLLRSKVWFQEVLTPAKKITHPAGRTPHTCKKINVCSLLPRQLVKKKVLYKLQNEGLILYQAFYCNKAFLRGELF